ncbi:PqiC family protein [Rhodopila sp.]|uniref:PqiC family protein n=1 Tax=Rhodopila sp. TaxID=2480087 RepID=UPI003D126FD8
MKACGTLLLILLVSGCGGPPTRFYTLAPVAPAATAGVPLASCPTGPVAVNHVLLPETLDRQSVVRADGTERLDISNQDRWAAPLDGMIQHVLAEDLRNRLPADRVLMPGDAPPPGGSAGIDINIQRFVGDAAGHVALRVDWTLLNRHKTVVATQSEAINADAASAGTDSLVAAMSRAVGDLADRIVVVLQKCPA